MRRGHAVDVSAAALRTGRVQRATTGAYLGATEVAIAMLLLDGRNAGVVEVSSALDDGSAWSIAELTDCLAEAPESQ